MGDRLWVPSARAFGALLFAFFAVVVGGAYVLTGLDTTVDDLGEQLDTIEANQADGRERAFIQRAQACILQPDDIAAMGGTPTQECRDREVVQWYPVEVCRAVPEFGAVPGCGVRAG